MLNNQKIVLLFVLSWLGIALLGVFSTKLILDKMQLQKTVSILEQRTHLGADGKMLRDIKSREDVLQNSVLEYMQWQLILKDQVLDARNRLNQQVAVIKGVKNKKELTGLLYYNLGLANTLAVNFPEAIKSFEEASRLLPQDAGNFYNLGLLYSAYKNNTKDAVRCYHKFLSLAPQDPRAETVKDRLKTLEK